MFSLRNLSRFVLFLATGMIFVADNQRGGATHNKKEGQGEDQVRQHALFAGGCFWCMESPFEKLEGVISVESGYAGGTTAYPSYENHAAGGHLEVVEVVFDAKRVSYQQLLDIYWRQIDPTDSGGQFVDRGHSYTTAIFYFTEEQRVLAEQSKKTLEESGLFQKPLATSILPAPPFYRAEEYHQDYYKTNPLRYASYRAGSGRDSFLKKSWREEKTTKSAAPGAPKQQLTPM